MAHFTIKNLSFTFPGGTGPALKGISLDIERGEYVLLCGKSGSGKSTLLRHMKSVLTPHGSRTGEILLDGTPLETLSQAEQAGRIGFVMQDPDDQIVTDKVWHELAFGLECLGVEQGAMRLRVAEMASFFGIQGWLHRDVGELSGGQKQLLNLAAIMAMQPEVLILDEPTSQLDPIAASDFLNTVRKINMELGTTVILTEHRLEDIFHGADRVVVLENGRILANDRPREVCRQLWQSRSTMFGALPAPTRAYYLAEAGNDPPLTVREGGRWLNDSFKEKSITQREPAATKSRTWGEDALRVKELWFRYEREQPDVLRGVSLTVPQGCVYAMVGGNGAGKSTLLKTICGICKPHRGHVQILGKDIKSYRDGSLYKGVLGMLPQNPKSLFMGQTLRDDLKEMTRDENAIRETAKLCGVEELLDRHPYDLSGGEQQRGALAKVLLRRPKLLLLDEPTKGMDSFFKERFGKLLEQLAQKGITVVMISHDVEFCAEYADLVSMLFDGEVVTTDIPRRFFGQNSFYTTAANRMSRFVFRNAVTAGDVAELYRKNRGPYED